MYRTLIILVFTSLCFPASALHRELSLQRALDLGLVKTKVISLGGYQGLCIQLQVQNLGRDSLMLLVEAGRRLNSIDDKDQDILVVKEEMMALKGLETKQAVLKGYCCQARLNAPGANALYDINRLGDSSLVTLARYLNKHEYNKHVEQQAVWALSENRSAATVTSINDSLVLPLRQLVADLKGEVLPWYTIVSSTYVYSNGVIVVTPQWLRGYIVYNNDRDDYVTLLVLDAKGTPVGQVKSEWQKAGSNGRYEVNIPLKSLDKGHYTVELKTPERKLAVQGFEL